MLTKSRANRFFFRGKLIKIIIEYEIYLKVVT